MASVAEKNADRLILTSDNPRTESPLTILEEIAAGLRSCGAVRTEPDRALAIGFALNLARAEDVVLLAGKGHEEFQEIKGQKFPFSDLAHARAVLSTRIPNHAVGSIA